MRAAVLRTNIRSSGGRLWAAASAITISVAFIVAGMLLADSLQRGIEAQAAEEIGGADIVLEPYALYEEGEEAVDQLVSDLTALDSVAEVDIRAEGFPSLQLILEEEHREDPDAAQEARDEVQGLIDDDTALFTQQEYIDQWIELRTGGATALQFVLGGFGAIAAFVSAIVIANTFQVVVASRRKTLGLLRAVGAGSAQLRSAALGEGALLGAAASVAGILLGWVAAWGLTVSRADLFGGGADLLPAQLTPAPALIAVLIGVGVTVFASAWPAVRSGRTSPMEALRPADLSSGGAAVPMVRTLAGVLFAVPGFGLTVYAAASEHYSDPVTGLEMPLLGIAGGMLTFFGTLLLGRLMIPVLVDRLGRLVGAVTGLRPSAPLAGRTARQSPGRTTATASALLVGVTLVVTFTVGAATTQAFLEEEFSDQGMIDQVLAVVLLLVAVSVVVAIIGVSNTMALSVMERRREAALLRALGSTRGTMGRMVSIEALLLALVALLIGTALGTFFGWAGVSSLIALEEVSIGVAMPWGRLALIWCAAAGAALLAAWLPARSFAQTPPAQGLAG